jgi:6-phosphogluconolactonase
MHPESTQPRLRRLVLPVALAALALAGSASPAGAAAGGSAPGAVYAMTNQRDANQIAVYDRGANGILSAPRLFPTGGSGSGAIDQSGNSLVLAGGARETSPDNLGGSSEYLFTVNTGSDSVTSFRLKGGDPVIADVQSGLDHPISVTYSKHRLFVLNASSQSCTAGTPTITGFTVAGDGSLTPIPGSTRPVTELPGPSGCTQISFNPRGDVIVVSQKLNNSLSTYTVGNDDIPHGPIYNKPTGLDPFAYSFTRQNQLVTAENYNSMFGGVSTYDVPPSGVLAPISPSVLTTRNDSCWVVITNDEKYFYVTNAVSGDITSYKLNNDGTIALLEPTAATVGPMAFDEALSGDSKYLYARSITEGSIHAYKVNQDGSLVEIQSIGGLPPGSAEGLASR